jgi:hypothetical protein
MRSAIALLITVIFVMIISVAIGYGFTQLKEASKVVEDEKLLYQSSMLLDDVLAILFASPQMQSLADSNSSDDLYLFLANSRYLPLEIGGEKVILSFESANAKVNINSLNRANEALFRDYFSSYMVGSSYVDILKECMRKNQAKDEYNSYTSTLFEKNPGLFREYIASKKHLDIINAFYEKEYGDTNLKNISFDELFSYSPNSAEAIDLNYAKPAVWELILGTSRQRAEMLSQGAGAYKTVKDLDLSVDEEKNIAKFKTTFFAPYLLVTVEIIREKSSSKIRFIYDVKLKRGYDFVLEV